MEILGVDNANEIWDDQAKALATVTGMRAAGMDGALMMSGFSTLQQAVGPVYEANDFQVWAGVNGDFNNGSGTWFNATSPPTATLANAQAIATAAANRLRGFRCYRGYNFIDEPNLDQVTPGDNAQVTRVALAARALRIADPGKAPTSVMIGFERTKQNYRAAKLRQLWLDVYPASTNNTDGQMTMAGYGLNNFSFKQYIDRELAEAAYDWRTHTLGIILQTHAAPGAALRRPTTREVREQFWQALMYFPTRVAWFIWRPQAGESWLGLRDDAAHLATVTALHAKVANVKALMHWAIPVAANPWSASAGMLGYGRTPGADGARHLLVYCNTSGSTASVTISGTAGYLRRTDTNEIKPVGSTWTDFAAGDGVVFEYTVAADGTPAGHDGPPQCPVRDKTEDASRDFWPNHPLNPLSKAYNPTVNAPSTVINASDYGNDLQAAYNAGPNAGNFTIRLAPGVTYTSALRMERGKNNVALECLDANNKAIIKGSVRVIPTPHAEYYHGNPVNQQCNAWTDAVKRNRLMVATSYHPQARAHDFIPGGTREAKQFLFRNVILDGGDRDYTHVATSTVSRLMFDGVQCQGFQWDGSGLHPAHLTGNSMIEQYYLRDVTFKGRYPYAAAGVNRPRYAVYLDGSHGSVFLRCATDANRYSSGMVTLLANDDYSMALDHGDEVHPEWWRIAQMNVFFDCTLGGQTYSSVGSVAGRQTLIQYCRTTGSPDRNFFEPQDKTQKAQVYLLGNIGGTEITTPACGTMDTKGEYSGTIAPYRYAYEGTRIEHCKVHGAFSLVGMRSQYLDSEALETPAKIRPLLGQVVVDDVVYGDTTSPAIFYWESSAGVSPGAYPSGPDTGTAYSDVTTVANVDSVTDPSVVPTAASAPTTAVFTTQPAGASLGTTLTQQPVVEVRDGSGALVSGYTGTVTMTLSGSGPTLTGTAAVSAVGGVATWTNLGLSGSAGTVQFVATVDNGAADFSVSSNAISIGATPGHVTPTAVYFNNASGLGVTVDVTSLGIATGDIVLLLLRKESDTPTWANISSWGSSLSFVEISGSRIASSNTNLFSLMAGLRVAAGAETSYTMNWQSSNGGRTSGYVVKLAGAASGTEALATNVSATASTGVVAPEVTSEAENDYLLDFAGNAVSSGTWTPTAGSTALLAATAVPAFVQGREVAQPGTVVAARTIVSPQSTRYATMALRVPASTVGAGQTYFGTGSGSATATGAGVGTLTAFGIGTGAAAAVGAGVGVLTAFGNGAGIAVASGTGDGSSTPVEAEIFLGAGTGEAVATGEGVGFAEHFGAGRGGVSETATPTRTATIITFGRRGR